MKADIVSELSFLTTCSRIKLPYSERSPIASDIKTLFELLGIHGPRILSDHKHASYHHSDLGSSLCLPGGLVGVRKDFSRC